MEEDMSTDEATQSVSSRSFAHEFIHTPQYPKSPSKHVQYSSPLLTDDISTQASSRSSIESPYQMPKDYDSKPQGRLKIAATESPYYLLQRDTFRYPEAPCFHGISQANDNLEHYEDYLWHNVKRLVRKPWKVNIANFRACMTNDILNSIRQEEFQDVRKVASNLVKTVLVEAVETANKQMQETNRKDLYEMPVVLDAPDPLVESFYWPQMNHFEPERMKMFIHDYVKQWNLDAACKFFIRYLSKGSTDTSAYHYYEALFSKPSPENPNPQTTASAYFTIDVSPVVVESMPVHVSYQFEGYTQVFVPDGRVKFQRFIINNIMKNKLRIFSELEF